MTQVLIKFYIQKKDENWYKDLKEEEYVLDPIEAYKR